MNCKNCGRPLMGKPLACPVCPGFVFDESETKMKELCDGSRGQCEKLCARIAALERVAQAVKRIFKNTTDDCWFRMGSADGKAIRNALAELEKRKEVRR